MGLNLFLPAAGFGSRLVPLTDHLPKPLIPIAGVPAIERILMQAHSTLDIEKIIINTHHLPRQIEAWAQAHPLAGKIHLLHEEEILGTGGALWNARDLLRDTTTLVLNSDVLSSMDLAALVDFHQEQKNDITLAVHHFDHAKTVGIGAEGKLICVGRDNDPNQQVDQWVGYACAALYQPSLIDLLPPGNSHVVSSWLTAREKNLSVGSWDVGDCYWRDIGLVEDFYSANREYLTALHHPFALAEPLTIPSTTTLTGWGSIGPQVKLSQGITIEESIILPGAVIGENKKIFQKIAGPGFEIPVTSNPSISTSHLPTVDVYPRDRFLGRGNGNGDHTRRNRRYLQVGCRLDLRFRPEVGEGVHRDRSGNRYAGKVPGNARRFSEVPPVMVPREG